MAKINTKFEQIGINMQYDSYCREQAIKRFARSCECCCTKGRYTPYDCDSCPIATVHKMVVAYFDDCDKKTKGGE